jgi:hypothetical protein
MTSPWSKPLSPEHQIEYDRLRLLADLQYRINYLDEKYEKPPVTKIEQMKGKTTYIDSVDELLDFLEQVMKEN